MRIGTKHSTIRGIFKQEGLLSSLEDKSITPIGFNVYRNKRTPFGISQDVRFRHTWIVGKTGCGKTTLIQNMCISDIYAGRGVTFLDPHGEAIENILEHCGDRENDVIYIAPSNLEYPFALNVLEHYLPGDKHRVCSDLIDVLRKQYSDSWGPRLEDILRNSILLLLDNPGTTIIELNRLLTDNVTRDKLLENCGNREVLWWFTHIFGQWSETKRGDAIQPVLNKISQFLTNPVARRIFGQEKSSFNYAEAMQQRKIILCDLSKGGAVGGDINSLIGSLIFARIWMSALSRPKGEREPHILYVDEFQNFATEKNTVEILSEARKYRLGCVLANQYKSQIPTAIAQAITENVGTLICFRVGPETASSLEINFAPHVQKIDLQNQHNYHCYIRTMVGAELANPFSARTFPPEEGDKEVAERVKEISTEKYCKPYWQIDNEIDERLGVTRGKKTVLPSVKEMLEVKNGS